MRRPLPVLGLVAAVVAVVAALVAGPAAARDAGIREQVEKQTVGGWAVTLRLRIGTGDDGGALRGLRIVAERGGRTVLDRAVALPGPCADGGCRVPDASIRTLQVKRLGGEAPTALLWLWTGGAHCCTVVQAVDLVTGTFTSRDFGNGGAVIEIVDGKPLFVAQDERFPYRYTSYAASGSPVQLFQLDGTTFRDVTAAHPAEVEADAREWWRTVVQARSGGDEVRGVFAAWAADACRLGRREKVEARLADGVRLGWFSLPRAESFGPYGARYASVLLADLEKLGYCTKG